MPSIVNGFKVRYFSSVYLRARARVREKKRKNLVHGVFNEVVVSLHIDDGKGPILELFCKNLIAFVPVLIGWCLGV